MCQCVHVGVRITLGSCSLLLLWFLGLEHIVWLQSKHFDLLGHLAGPGLEFCLCSLYLVFVLGQHYHLKGVGCSVLFSGKSFVK